MARDQAVKIQILSVRHTGLLRAVDDMFEKFAPLREVREMIEREYQEKISIRAISKYKKKFWKVQKDKLQDQKTSIQAFGEMVGEEGLAAGVRAFLWQALQAMRPLELISLKKALNDDQKVDLMKKRFALFAQEHRQKMKERREASKDGSETDDPAENYAKAQRVVQQVKEIFGIGMTEIEPPHTPLLGTGQESPSPEAVAVAAEPGV